jgi:hypothetical protein
MAVPMSVIVHGNGLIRLALAAHAGATTLVTRSPGPARVTDGGYVAAVAVASHACILAIRV